VAVLVAMFPAPPLAASGSLTLEVRDTLLRSRLACAPIRPGERFSLRYTHSTAKTEVEEEFQVIGPDEILLDRMLYASAGAGIPDVAPPGTRFRVEGGRFVLEGVNQRFSALERIRVAYFYPFILRIGERQYRLSDLARGRLVDLTVMSAPDCGDDRSARE
jgi:hypothetical protein